MRTTPALFLNFAVLVCPAALPDQPPPPNSTPPSNASPPAANTVHPASLFFSLLSLALLTSSQPTGHTPFYSFFAAPVLRSLRTSPLFCLIDTVYILVYLPLLMYGGNTLTEAARVLVYTKLTPNPALKKELIHRATDRVGAAAAPYESLVRDTRFRIVVGGFSLLQFLKLFGMRGVMVFVVAGCVYVVAWGVTEGLYLLARENHDDWWDGMSASGAHAQIMAWKEVGQLFALVTQAAFAAPCVGLLVAINLKLWSLSVSFDPASPGAGAGSLATFLAYLPSYEDMEVPEAVWLVWLLGIMFVILLMLFEFLSEDMTALVLGIISPSAGGFILIYMHWPIFLLAVLECGALFILTVLLPGIIAYGGWNRCPQHVQRARWDDHWSLLWLLVVDERVFVVQQLIWAILLCYSAFDTEGSEKSAWTENLG